MKIMLFAAGGDIGGGKTHILSLAGMLSKRNTLRLVSFRHGVLAEEAVAMGIDTVVVDAAAGYSYAIKQAVSQYDEFKPDIVHCHGPKANMIGAVLKIKRGALVISTVHSDPKLDYLGTPLKKYTYGVVNQLSLRKMDYIVAVAGGMRKLLISRGFDPFKLYAIYNGIDFSDAPLQTRPEKPNDNTITIGIAARLNPVKDIKTVIKAFSIAYAQDKRLRLSIAGGGEEKKMLLAYAQECGVSEVTVFEGWIDDIKSYFKRVDINVLASLSETFPYSLLEGAYEHCPAIATNVGGIPYLIKHGESGYLFEPGDAETFAKYILRLAQDPALRSRLAENLYRKAKAEYSLERMAKDQQEFYESMLKRESAKGRRGAILCGAYGKGNAGDEAIMRAILTELKGIDPNMPFWVMSRNPQDTSQKESVRSFYIFNVLKFFNSLRKAELFVNGGGTLIQDVTSTRSLNFYLFTLRAAKRMGCRVIMYGCGIGPIGKPANRARVAKVINETADIITLRDSSSLELLIEIGVDKPEIILSADPTVSLPVPSDGAIEAALEAEGIMPGEHLLGITVREWADFSSFSEIIKACEYAYEKYGLKPVFIPFESPRDDSITAKLAAETSVPHFVFRNKHDSEELIGMLGKMDAVLGMRLHSLIFATAAGTPVIGVSYDPKVAGFIKDIGSDASIPLDKVSAAALMQALDKLMAAGKEGGERTCNALKTAEKNNQEAARRLINR